MNTFILKLSVASHALFMGLFAFTALLVFIYWYRSRKSKKISKNTAIPYAKNSYEYLEEQAARSVDPKLYMWNNLGQVAESSNRPLNLIFYHCNVYFAGGPDIEGDPKDIPKDVSNASLKNAVLRYQMNSLMFEQCTFLLDQYLNRGITPESFLLSRGNNLNHLTNLSCALNDRELAVSRHMHSGLLKMIDAGGGTKDLGSLLSLLLRSECDLVKYFDTCNKRSIKLQILLTYISNGKANAIGLEKIKDYTLCAIQSTYSKFEKKILHKILLKEESLPDRLVMQNYLGSRSDEICYD